MGTPQRMAQYQTWANIRPAGKSLFKTAVGVCREARQHLRGIQQFVLRR